MILDAIKKRYSTRNFSEKEIQDSAINNILEAGRLAVSWVNVQPWHFIVVKSQDTKKLLSKYAYGQPHVTKAPVVIVCCGDLNAWNSENYSKVLKARADITDSKINSIVNDPTLNPSLKDKEILLARTLEEVTYATAYMTLEAYEQGLGSCIIGKVGNELTGFLSNEHQELAKALNLPENFFIANLLLIGYPESSITPALKHRKTFDEVVSFEKFGNK